MLMKDFIKKFNNYNLILLYTCAFETYIGVLYIIQVTLSKYGAVVNDPRYE